VLLGFVAKTANLCHQGNYVDNRSMNVTFQSGAMGHPINAQTIDMCRMGAPVVAVPTAIKSNVIAMTSSAGRFLAKVQRVHLRIAIKKSTPREAGLDTVV
jgi:hypothetical protein